MKQITNWLLIIGCFILGVPFGTATPSAILNFNRITTTVHFMWLIPAAILVLSYILDRHRKTIIDRTAAFVAGGSGGFIALFILLLAAAGPEIHVYPSERAVLTMILGLSIVSTLCIAGIAYTVKSFLK